MTFRKLILSSIWHFRRQHLAVFAGTLISTAVLTGALIVGDSVKYSLRQLVDVRLGNARYALQTGDRFVRANLATDIAEKENIRTTSLLGTQGVAKNPSSDDKINQAEIYGINEDFWTLSNLPAQVLKSDEAIISESVAEKLNVKPGDEILLRIFNAGIIPLNAPFAQDIKTATAFRVKIKSIIGDNNMGRFSLKNSQAVPFNIFVSRNWLSEKLDLKGKANIILAGGINSQEDFSEKLNQTFSEVWQPDDLGLKVRELDEPGKYELLSNRIFIEEPVSKAVHQLNFNSKPVLTYIVNSIRFHDKETPYSFVSAVSEPFVPASLKENEIVINQWLAGDLGAKKGDTLSLSYFVIGPLRRLSENKRLFRVADVVSLTKNSDLQWLMPDFPGLADAGKCHDWETGIPIDLKKIRKKDEDYWDEFKGTPKAFISLNEGVGLWANDFGCYTAFRFNENEISSENLLQEIMKKINPADVGLQFIPVYERGLDAVVYSVDFGELFLSLSFFVIAAGVLLSALLYALFTESRKQEAGVLSALGFQKSCIIKLRIAESALTAVFGGIAGSLAGILYNEVIIVGLNSVWQGAVQTNTLTVFINPVTVLTGAVSGILIGLAVIFFITRHKLKQPASVLVKSPVSMVSTSGRKALLMNFLLIFTGFTGAAIMVLYSVLTSVDSNSGLFLSAGGLFLVGSIAVVHRFFMISNLNAQNKPLSLFELSVKNAGRNAPRSLATVTLLALGIFTIVVTGANRKTFFGTENSRGSGTGGFLFWAESTIPFLYDLNTVSGKEKYNLENEPELKGVSFVQFNALEGDDASCLNLNQVSQPQIISVPARIFDKRKSFSFAAFQSKSNSENPWLELTMDYGENVIPALADQTVITWGLMKRLGDTLFYLNEKGEEIKLLLVGGLQSSIFQGNILISDSIFRINFPSVSGSKIMLVDAPSEKQQGVSALLESRLADQGIIVTPSSVRLAEFNTVTNTYLSVFMALGGMGILIGTIGLGIVLLRNILERKHELALLRALGFTHKMIFKMIFIENLLLLLTGTIAGIAAAIIGILPSILTPSFSMDSPTVLLLILLILASGVCWIFVATRQSLKGRLMDSLNAEKV